MKTRILTAAWLHRQKPCEDLECLALLHFGPRVELTRAFLLEAAALGLPMDWLAARLYTPAQQAVYEAASAPARATYQAAYASARAAYEAACASALAAYQAACASALAAYQAASASALADALGLP